MLLEEGPVDFTLLLTNPGYFSAKAFEADNMLRQV
jgi:hypothetical protein